MTETEKVAASLSEVAAAMESLATAFTQSIEADRQDRIQEAHRLAHGRRRWYAFITLALAVLLGATVYYGRTLTDASDKARETNKIVLDCTTPGGQCYERKAAASAANNRAIIVGLDADNQKAVKQLEQQICDLFPNDCVSGLHPTHHPTTTTTPGG